MADVVSEPEKPVNRLSAGESSASGPSPASALSPSEDQRLAAASRRQQMSALGVVLLLWTLQYAFFTLDRLYRDPGAEGWLSLVSRLIVTSIGVLLSLAILRALRRSAGRPFVQRAIMAIALALAAAVLHSIANIVIFRLVAGVPAQGFSIPSLLPALAQLVYFFSWVHLAIALVLLSLVYGEEIMQARRGLAQVAGELGTLREMQARNSGGHLWVRRGSELVRLEASSIDWIAAEGECARIHVGGRSYLERTSLSVLAEKLAPSGFLRIHRSTIVNAKRIESVVRTRSGSLQLRLHDGEQLRVSKSFQPAVRKLTHGMPTHGG